MAKDNATTTSTKAKAGNIKTAPDNAKKPEDVKVDVPDVELDAAGNEVIARSPSGSATTPDATSDAARLGGRTVGEIKADQ